MTVDLLTAHDEPVVVDLLARLVAIATESTTPNRALIDLVADHLETFGAHVAVIEGQTGRANLLARIGPDVAGGVLLSGHTDVVPAGTGWATEPYSLTERDGVLFGRGSADMKGFIACVLAVLERTEVSRLVRPVHVALSFEEVGCVGVRGLLDHVGAEVRPGVIVVGEPTMMRPRHADMGKVAYRLGFHAAAAHSSLAPFRPNAISTAVATINALEAIAAPHRLAATTDASGERAAEVTVNVGTITGGTALNVLSELCELTFELRHTTRFDPDELLAPLWTVVAADPDALAAESDRAEPIEVTEITRYPALSTDTDDPWVRLVERLADRGRSTPIGFGTEGGLFAAAIDAPVLICGPGDIGVAHKPDEHVSIEQLRACVGFVERLIDEVCVNDGSPVSSAASAAE